MLLQNGTKALFSEGVAPVCSNGLAESQHGDVPEVVEASLTILQNVLGYFDPLVTGSIKPSTLQDKTSLLNNVVRIVESYGVSWGSACFRLGSLSAPSDAVQTLRDVLAHCLMVPDLAALVEHVAPGATAVLYPWMIASEFDETTDAAALMYILSARLAGNVSLASLVQKFTVSDKAISCLSATLTRWMKQHDDSTIGSDIQLRVNILLCYAFQALTVAARVTALDGRPRLKCFRPFVSASFQLLQKKENSLAAFEYVRLSSFGFLCVVLQLPEVFIERLASNFALNNALVRWVLSDTTFFPSESKPSGGEPVGAFMLENAPFSKSPFFGPKVAKNDKALQDFPGSSSTGPSVEACAACRLEDLPLSFPSLEVRALAKSDCPPFCGYGMEELDLWCRPAMCREKRSETLAVEPAHALKVLRELALGVTGKISCLLVGASGTGKSHYLQLLYKLLRPLDQSDDGILWLYLDEGTDAKTLVGSWESGETPGTFVWKDGVLVRAMLTGRWVIVENIDTCSAEIQAKLCELADSRILSVPERHTQIVANEHFQLHATITCSSDSDQYSLVPKLLQNWHIIACPQMNQSDLTRIACSRFPSLLPVIPLICNAFQVINQRFEENKTPLSSWFCPRLSHTLLFRFLAHLSYSLGHCHLGVPLLEHVRLAMIEEFYYTVALSFPFPSSRFVVCEQLGEFLDVSSDLVQQRIRQVPPVALKENVLSFGTVVFSAEQLGTPRGVATREFVPKSSLMSFSYTSVHARITRAIAMSLAQKEPVLLVGSTGAGKTTLVQHLAQTLGQDVVVYNFSDQSEACDLIGRTVQEDAAGLIEKLRILWLPLLERSTFLLPSQQQELRGRMELRRASGDWKGCVQLLRKVCLRCETLLTQQGQCSGASSLLVEWGCLKRKCEALEAHPLLVETGAFRDFVPGANTSLRSTRFRFEEGALVTALRKGQWLVLDEVNLAPPDILQRLRGLLLTYHTGKQTFVLSEHTGEEIVPHENFRIFGCMNPPIQLNVVPEDAAGMKTDCGVSHQAEQYQPQLIVSAGKKDLPMDIRSCFAEFYVDEVWTLSDLTEIVSRLLPYADERFARQVAEFYIQARRLCLNYALTTGAGSVPHFSLRNLTRAVRYAVTASTRVWHPRKLLGALADGLIANFMTGLKEESYQRMMELLKSCFSISEDSLVTMQRNGVTCLKSSSCDGKALACMAEVDYAVRKGASSTDFATLPQTSVWSRSEMGKRFKSDDLQRREELLRLPLNQNISEAVRWVSVEGYPISCGAEVIDVQGAHYDMIVTPSVRKNVQRIARVLSGSRVPLLLEGPTSAGKSSLVKFLCRLTGHRCVRINNHEHTDVQEYLGQHVIHPVTGQLVFVEGAIAQAARYGHWVILDELNLAPSEVLEALNRLLDLNRKLFIPETGVEIDAHPDFMVFATQNPAGGAYGGRKLLSTAFRNRFVELTIDELPPNELNVVLQTRCILPPSFTKAMLEVYTELKARRLKTSVLESSSSFMTIRDLLRWGFRQPDSKEALAREGCYLIAERLRDSDEKRDIQQLIERVCLGNKKKLEAFTQRIDFQEDPVVLEIKKKLKATEALNGLHLSLTDPMARLVALVQRCIMFDEPVLLVGETGAGKTSLCQVLSLLAGRPLRIVNCHQQTEAADLIGLLQPVKDRRPLWAEVVSCGFALLRVISAGDNVLRSFAADHHPITQLQETLQSVKRQIGDMMSYYKAVSENGLECQTAEENGVLGAAFKPLSHGALKSLLTELEVQVARVNATVKYSESPDDSSETYDNGALLPAAEELTCEGPEPTDFGKNYSATATTNVSVEHGSEPTYCTATTAKRPNTGGHSAKKRRHNTTIKDVGTFQKTLDYSSTVFLNAVQRAQQLFEWVDGPLVRCMQEGAHLLLDEISLADDATLERLNSVLEPERFLALAEKGGAVQQLKPSVGTVSDIGVSVVETVCADKRFRLFATMNPGGDFGKRELSPALRNRFTEIWVPAVHFASSDTLRLIEEKLELLYNKATQELKNLSKEQAILCSLDVHPLAVAIQKTVCWYNERVKHPLSVREVLAWIEFLRVFVLRTCTGVANLTPSALGRVLLEGFFHGGYLTCLDGLPVGTGCRRGAQNVIDYSECRPDSDATLVDGFLEFLVCQAKKHLCSAWNVEVEDVAEQFKRDGFAWLYDALDHIAELTVETESDGSSVLKVGPFLLPCCVNSNVSPAALARHSAAERGGRFLFTAPTTAMNFGRVIRAMQLPRAVLLEGPPGAGKTSLIQALAELTGTKLVRINLSEQTDLADLLGSDLPEATRMSLWTSEAEYCVESSTAPGAAGMFRWVDGVLVKAMMLGHWVLLDELNLASQQVLEGFNALLDHRREVFIPQLDRVVQCAPSFRLFAAQNPSRDGGGRKGLPRSFLNRFSRITVQQLAPPDLEAVVLSRWNASQSAGSSKNAQYSLTLLRLVESLKEEQAMRPFRGGMAWEWNLRDASRLALLAEHGCPTLCVETAADVVLLSRLRDEKDVLRAGRRIVKELRSVGYSALSKGAFGVAAKLERELESLDIALLPSEERSSVGLNGEDDREHGVIGCWNGFGLPLSHRIIRTPEEVSFGGTIILPRKATSKPSRVPLSQPAACGLFGQKHIVTRLACAAAFHWAVLLTGPPGVGKAASVHFLAKCCGVRLHELSLTESVDVSEILGTYEPETITMLVHSLKEQLYAVTPHLAFLALNNSSEQRGAAQSAVNMLLGFLESARFLEDMQQLGCDIAAVDSWIRDVQRELKLWINPKFDSDDLSLLLTAVERLVFVIREKIRSNSEDFRFRWADGQLVQAVERGEWILFRHIHFASPALLDRLNSLLEPDGNFSAVWNITSFSCFSQKILFCCDVVGFLLLTECGEPHIVRPHPNSRIFFTSEASQEADLRLSKALRNRCVELHFGAFPFAYNVADVASPHVGAPEVSTDTQRNALLQKGILSERCTLSRALADIFAAAVTAADIAEKGAAYRNAQSVVVFAALLEFTRSQCRNLSCASPLLPELLDAFQLVPSGGRTRREAKNHRLFAALAVTLLKALCCSICQLSVDFVDDNQQEISDDAKAKQNFFTPIVNGLRSENLDTIYAHHVSKRALLHWTSMSAVASSIVMTPSVEALWASFELVCGSAFLQSPNAKTLSSILDFARPLFCAFFSLIGCDTWNRLLALVEHSCSPAEAPIRSGDSAGCFSPARQLTTTIRTGLFSVDLFLQLSSSFRYSLVFLQSTWSTCFCAERRHLTQFSRRLLLQCLHAVPILELPNFLSFLKIFLAATEKNIPPLVFADLKRFVRNVERYCSFIQHLGVGLETCVKRCLPSRPEVLLFLQTLSPLQQAAAVLVQNKSCVMPFAFPAACLDDADVTQRLHSVAVVSRIYKDVLELLAYIPSESNSAVSHPANVFDRPDLETHLTTMHDTRVFSLWDLRLNISVDPKASFSSNNAFLRALRCSEMAWLPGPTEVAHFLDACFQSVDFLFREDDKCSEPVFPFLDSLCTCVGLCVAVCKDQAENCLLCNMMTSDQNSVIGNQRSSNSSQAVLQKLADEARGLWNWLSRQHADQGLLEQFMDAACRCQIETRILSAASGQQRRRCSNFLFTMSDPVTELRIRYPYIDVANFLLDRGLIAALSRGLLGGENYDSAVGRRFQDVVHVMATVQCMRVVKQNRSCNEQLFQMSRSVWDSIAPQCTHLLVNYSKQALHGVIACQTPKRTVFPAIDVCALLHIVQLFRYIADVVEKWKISLRSAEASSCTGAAGAMSSVLSYLSAAKTFVLEHCAVIVRHVSVVCLNVLGPCIVRGLSCLVATVWECEALGAEPAFAHCVAVAQRLDVCAKECFTQSRELLSALSQLMERYQRELPDMLSVSTSFNTLFSLSPSVIQVLCSGHSALQDAPTTPAAPSLSPPAIPVDIQLADPDSFVSWQALLALKFGVQLSSSVRLKDVDELQEAAHFLQALTSGWDATAQCFTATKSINMISPKVVQRDSTLLWDWVVDGIADLCARLDVAFKPANKTLGEVLVARRTEYALLFNDALLQIRTAQSTSIDSDKATARWDNVTEVLQRSVSNATVAMTLVSTQQTAVRDADDVQNVLQASATNAFGVASLHLFTSLIKQQSTVLKPSSGAAQTLSPCLSLAASVSVSSKSVLYQLLWLLSCWRLHSCAGLICGASYRDAVLSHYLTTSLREASRFSLERSFEDLNTELIYGYSGIPTATSVQLQIEAAHFNKLASHLKATLPLRPPLCCNSLCEDQKSLCHALQDVGDLQMHSASIHQQLEQLQVEVSTFVKSTWCYERLHSEFPWMFSSLEPCEQNDDPFVLAPSACAYFIFLLRATTGFLDTLYRSYPLSPDVLGSLAFVFHQAFSSVIGVLKEKMESHATRTESKNTLLKAAQCHNRLAVLPLGHPLQLGLTQDNQKFSRTVEIDRQIWQSEWFEYTLQLGTVDKTDVAQLMESFLKMCSYYEEDQQRRKAIDAEKFATYIQQQAPSSGAAGESRADIEASQEEVAEQLFPQGNFASEDVFEEKTLASQCSGSYDKMADQEDEFCFVLHAKQKSTTSNKQKDLQESWNFTASQADRFVTVLYNLSHTLTARLCRVARLRCGRNAVESTNVSAAKEHLDAPVLWSTELLLQPTFDETLLRTSLGFALLRRCQSTLPASIDARYEPEAALIRGVLRHYVRRLEDAVAIDDLKRQYAAVFEGTATSRVLMTEDNSDDEKDEDQVDALDDVAALARARRRLAAYKSQKVRFQHLQRLMRASQNVVESNREQQQDLAVSSFYSDAWPSVYVAAYPDLLSIEKRVQKLLNLFPDHPALMKILDVMEAINNLPLFSTTPMAFLNALELLSSRCEKWEVFAHRGVTLKAQVAVLQKHLLLLRHHQLDDWKQLRNYREESHAKAAFKWLPELIAVVKELMLPSSDHMPDVGLQFPTTRSSSEAEQCLFGSALPATDSKTLKERCQYLWSYLEQNIFPKPIGEFEARLNVIILVSQLFQTSTLEEPSTVVLRQSQIGWLLGHFAAYCGLVREKADTVLASGRRAMDHELKSLLRIVRWDFTRPAALKVSIQKGHYQLGKSIKKFDAFLQVPLIECLTSSTTPFNASTGSRDVLDASLPSASCTNPTSLSASLTSHVVFGGNAAPKRSGGFNRVMSRKKKFCLSSSSAPENAVESSSSLWGDIVQKSILAFAHTFNCFTRASLVGWLRDLVEEVQAAAQAVDTTTAAHKKRWCQELRDRLKSDLQLVPLSRNAHIDIVLSDAGILHLNSVAHLVLGLPEVPQWKTNSSTGPVFDAVANYAPDSGSSRDPLCSFLRVCLANVAVPIDAVATFETVPKLWAFAQQSTYRQIRRYTQLQKSKASCHSDITVDHSHDFWIGASGFLLEMTQCYLQELWKVSQQFTELLDLATVAHSPAYFVPPLCLNALATKLDLSSGLIQPFLTFLKETNKHTALELFPGTECCVKMKTKVFTVLQMLQKQLGLLNNFLCVTPELRIFRRDPRISVFCLESRRIVLDLLQPLQDVFSIDFQTTPAALDDEDPKRCEYQDFLCSEFSDAILSLFYVPMGVRQSFLQGLATLAVLLSRLLCLKSAGSPLILVQSFKPPAPASETLPKNVETVEAFSDAPSVFHLVHALQRCAALPLSEWIVALKDCFCAVAATEAGSSVLPDLEQQSSSFASFAAFKLNHDLASFIVQTLCVMLSTLDSAVALGGTGILISKIALVLFKSGYCREKDTELESASAEGQPERTKDEWVAGTGMGEGEGLNDVSQEIEDSSLLEGYKHEKPNEKSESEREKEDELENEERRSDDAFAEDIDAMAPSLHDKKRDKKQDEEQDEASQTDDVERELGSVDLENGGDIEKKQKFEEDHGDSFSSEDEQEKEERPGGDDKIETVNGKPQEQLDDLVADQGDQGDQGERQSAEKDQSASKNQKDDVEEHEIDESCSNASEFGTENDVDEDFPSHNVALDGLPHSNENDQDIDMDLENYDNDLAETASVASNASAGSDTSDANEVDPVNDDEVHEQDDNSSCSPSSEIDSDEKNHDCSVDVPESAEDAPSQPDAAQEHGVDDSTGCSLPTSSQQTKGQCGVQEDFLQINSSNLTCTLADQDQPAAEPQRQPRTPFSDEKTTSSSANFNPSQSAGGAGEENGNAKETPLNASQQQLFGGSQVPPPVTQTSSSETSRSLPAPNPLLSDTAEPLERWLNRVHLTKTEDAADQPLDKHNEDAEMNGETPLGTHCKKDNSSEKKGLAETLNSETPSKQSAATEDPCQKAATHEEIQRKEEEEDIGSENSTLPTTSSEPYENVDERHRQHNTCRSSSVAPFEDREAKTAPKTDEREDELESTSLQQKQEEFRQRVKEEMMHLHDEPSARVQPSHVACGNVPSTAAFQSATTSNDDQSTVELDATQRQSSNAQALLSRDVAKDVWETYGLQTTSAAAQLCEQLRIVLEPTLSGRFSGDYRTGKRLSMRKVVTFIASNFRRDKIWLRRTRPSRRDYRIVIALDNSRSMSECGVGQKALKAIATVCMAFQRLELGKTGLCAFGGAEPRVVLPLNDTVYDEETGARIVQAFTFDQESQLSHDQALPGLFDLAFQQFDAVASPQGHSRSSSVQQMLLILSDGRFNKHALRGKVNAALARGTVPILIIIDASGAQTLPESGSTSAGGRFSDPLGASKPVLDRASTSILDMKEVSWEHGKLVVKRYLDDFPLPFYAVVHCIAAIPDVVTDIVRQWIEMLTRK